MNDDNEDGLQHGYISEEGKFVPVGPRIPIPRYCYMSLWLEMWRESLRLATWKN
jgi:hypothetical protein